MIVVVYAKHHDCKLKKDRVYGLRELVAQWKEHLTVDYNMSDLEVYTKIAELGLFDNKQRGNEFVAQIIWDKMNLGSQEHFKTFAANTFHPMTAKERKTHIHYPTSDRS